MQFTHFSFLFTGTAVCSYTFAKRNCMFTEKLNIDTPMKCRTKVKFQYCFFDSVLTIATFFFKNI